MTQPTNIVSVPPLISDAEKEVKIYNTDLILRRISIRNEFRPFWQQLLKINEVNVDQILKEEEDIVCDEARSLVHDGMYEDMKVAEKIVFETRMNLSEAAVLDEEKAKHIADTITSSLQKRKFDEVNRIYEREIVAREGDVGSVVVLEREIRRAIVKEFFRLINDCCPKKARDLFMNMPLAINVSAADLENHKFVDHVLGQFKKLLIVKAGEDLFEHPWIFSFTKERVLVSGFIKPDEFAGSPILREKARNLLAIANKLHPEFFNELLDLLIEENIFDMKPPLDAKVDISELFDEYLVYDLDSQRVWEKIHNQYVFRLAAFMKKNPAYRNRVS
jgi:hypothetical protein